MRLCLPASCLLLALAACAPAGAPEDAAAPALTAEQRAELEALEALAAQVEADRAEVAGFEITGARYTFEPDPRTGQPQPAVHLALANGTPLVVAKLSVQASFLRAGEPGPWHSQEFHLPIDGGLAPGAGTAVRMIPASDSDWALKAPPAEVEVIARVVPVALEGADGRRRLTAHAFGPAQQARLALLRAGRP
jgi:hypothetical protein